MQNPVAQSALIIIAAFGEKPNYLLLLRLEFIKLIHKWKPLCCSNLAEAIMNALELDENEVKLVEAIIERSKPQ